MKNLLLVLFIFSAVNLMAQTTSVPDSNFEQALIDAGYDSGTPDGVITTATAAAATGSLTITQSGITNLTGLEAFTSLTSFTCANNSVVTVPDLSGTSLVSLKLDNNSIVTPPAIPSSLIDLYLHDNSLTSYPDISNNNMRYFHLERNSFASTTQPGTSYVSGHTNLVIFGLESCNVNSFPSLVNLTNLKTVYASSNNLTSMPTMSNLPALENFYATSNSITSLPDLSGFTSLKNLKVNGNALTSASALPTSLESLNLSDNQLDNSDFPSGFSGLTSLLTLRLERNNFTDLPSYPSSVTTFYIYYNDLTDSDCGDVSTAYGAISNFLYNPTNSTYIDCIDVYIPDTAFKTALVAAYDTNSDGEIGTLEAQNASGWMEVDALGIEDLTGLEAFKNIGQIHAEDNLFTSVPDISHFTQLTKVFFDGNPGLTTLPDFTDMTDLHTLSAGYCDLTSLPDLTGCTDLLNILVPYNPRLGDADSNLANLVDFTEFYDFRALDVRGCGLTSLGTSLPTTMTELYAASNALTTVPALSGLTGLRYLNLGFNQLQEVPSLSGLTDLKRLRMEGNDGDNLSGLRGITAMPAGMSTLTALEHLNISQTDIESLGDLSNNTALIEIYATSAYLTVLPNLSSHSSLVHLQAPGNAIGADPNATPVPGLPTSLTYLDISQNFLDDSTVPDLSTFSSLDTIMLHSNLLDSVPSLPSNWTYLSLYYNNLSSNDCANIPAGSVWNPRFDGIYVDCAGANMAPVFNTTGGTEVLSGVTYNYFISTTDPESDSITVALQTGPSFLSLTDHGDGSVTLTGTPGTSDAGSHLVKVTTTDSYGSSSTEQYYLNVTVASATLVLGTPTGSSTDESGTTVSFTAYLNGTGTLSSAVTFPLYSTNPLEGMTVDSGGAPLSELQFTELGTSGTQTIYVKGVDDGLNDGTKNYDIIVGPSSAGPTGYVGIGGGSKSFTNTDNDTVVLVTPTSGHVVASSGSTSFFDVILLTAPASGETVTATFDVYTGTVGGVSYTSCVSFPSTATQISVDFTSSTPDLKHRINLVAGSLAGNVDENFRIVGAGLDSDTDNATFEGVVPPAVTGVHKKINGNNPDTVSFAASSMVIGEGSTGNTIALNYTGATRTNTFTVSFQITGTAERVVDYEIDFGSGNKDQVQITDDITIPIDLVDDAFAETVPEYFDVTIKNATGGVKVALDTIRVYIQDND